MEPASETISYCVMVANVEEKFTYQHVSGIGKDAEFEKTSLGWYILYEGSYEAMFVGYTRPPFNPGDVVEIIQRKVHNAKPRQATSKQVR